ncbi:DNA-binding protein [Streptomyces sp. NPDC058548]|uniref:DNA-binding protein n=1 Tax=Streptomyces sp. NPDC058548 TaxID=3346545 RepID=UPI003660183B
MTQPAGARRSGLRASEALQLPVMFDVWPTVGQALGIGRTATYQLAREDALPIPVVRVGRLLRARRSDLLTFLGLDNNEAAAGATAAASSERTTEPA